MPHDVLEDLLGNLRKTNRVYASLLDVARQKQTHILGNHIEELREDLSTEGRLAEDGTRLNTERKAIHRECRGLLNAGVGVETLEDLCRFMPAEWHDRFAEERKGLRHTLESLQDVNRINVALVNNSLSLMEGLLTALFDTVPVTTYGPRGLRAKSELQVRSLDTRA